MRVLILISSCYPDIGGHEVFAREIANINRVKRLLYFHSGIEIEEGLRRC